MSSEAPESRDKQPEAVSPPASGSTPPSHSVHIKFKFLEQLKRRNVVRVAILYVVVCYLILEPFGLLVHVLALPEWIGRTVVVLMAVGFPAVLLFACVYEITPEGLKQTVEVDPQRSIRKLTGQRLNRAIVAVMAVALAYFVVDKFWLSKHATTEQPAASVASVAPGPTSTAMAVSDKSIAVLPFVDMSEKRDQEYFSDGLSEELIDHLTRAKDLKVIARTSSFSFKGKNEDVRAIASKLGVAHLLEGSVRKSGATLRITAQLIRAADGTHLWSQTYDRSLADIFKVQDEIAGTVAQALHAALNTGIAGAHEAPSVEAHNLLLQGNFFLDRTTKRDTEKALSLYQQAIELDPNYALVWVKLASANMSQAGNGWVPIVEATARARDYLTRALKIDPNLPSAHSELGWLYLSFDWNWKAAKAEYDLARKLDPNDDNAEETIAWIDAIRYGRLEKTITLAQQHMLRDPLDTAMLGQLGFALYAAGRRSEAEVVWRKLEELNPNYAGGHAWWAIAQVLMGRNTEALATVGKETDEAWRLSASPVVYWALGRRTESDAALNELERKYAAGSAYNIAEMHAYRGEVGPAFDWLARAYRQRDGGMQYLAIDPLLSGLHADRRWRPLLVKMNLAD